MDNIIRKFANYLNLDLMGDILLIVTSIGLAFYFWNTSRLLSWILISIITIKLIGLKFGKC